MKKTLICFLLCLVLPLSALAARMPALRGPVTDDANVLSAQMSSDIQQFARKLEDETDIELHVAVVHFLDGLDAQTYANELFAKWKLDDDALLVLVAAGEDLCATVMGEDAAQKLGRSNAESLLYTSSAFSTLIRAQRYDEAFAAYCPALNALVEKQLGESIRLNGLFGVQAEHAPARFASELWGEVQTALQDSGERIQQRWEDEEKQENGLTAGGWIVLIILVVIVLRKKPIPTARRGCGCGCSPLVWLLGLFGLGRLFDRE